MVDFDDDFNDTKDLYQLSKIRRDKTEENSKKDESKDYYNYFISFD